MRLFGKLLAGFTLLVLLALAIDCGLRYRREVAQFETDLRQDAQSYGAILVNALELAWKTDGEAGAQRLLARANEVVPDMRFEWIWLDTPEHRLASVARQPGAAELTPGKTISVSVVRPPPDSGEEMVTLVGGRAPSGRPGALALHQSLARRDAYAKTTLRNTFLLTTLLLVAVTILAAVLGRRLVARPVAALVAKARRVAKADFSGPLTLSHHDELGELANEMNRMCEQLTLEIGARKEAVEQLRHADRLMTVGKLASGIAHELGTPLNVVAGSAGLIADGEVEGEEARDHARMVVEQARRMTTIIRQLLDFARPRKPHLAEVDLRALAKRTVELVHPITHKASVAVDVDRGAPLVAHCDEAQVQQVITNLVVNAAQATPAGGHVHVECDGAVEAPPGSGTARAWARLVVTDTGSGMDEATQRRIFEPFFTTKEVGSGSGLGLSVSFGIVREHGGWIDVQSAPGQGSKFLVYLPAT